MFSTYIIFSTKNGMYPQFGWVNGTAWGALQLKRINFLHQTIPRAQNHHTGTPTIHGLFSFHGAKYLMLLNRELWFSQLTVQNWIFWVWPRHKDEVFNSIHPPHLSWVVMRVWMCSLGVKPHDMGDSRLSPRLLQLQIRTLLSGGGHTRLQPR